MNRLGNNLFIRIRPSGMLGACRLISCMRYPPTCCSPPCFLSRWHRGRAHQERSEISRGVYVTLTVYLLIALDSKAAWRSRSGHRQSHSARARRHVAQGAHPVMDLSVVAFWRPVAAGGRGPRLPRHYGSVSAVTFITATNYLKGINESYENYATAFSRSWNPRPSSLGCCWAR